MKLYWHLSNREKFTRSLWTGLFAAAFFGYTVYTNDGAPFYLFYAALTAIIMWALFQVIKYRRDWQADR